MRKLGIIASALAVAAASSTASAQFLDCQSWSNQGQNLSTLYISFIMKQAGCEASSERISDAEALLERLFSGIVLPGSPSAEFKTCYLAGLYEGYQSQIVTEYEACNALTPAETLGGAAGAVFVSAVANLGPDLDSEALEQIFKRGPLLRQSRQQFACQSALLEVSADLLESGQLGATAFEAAALACGGKV